MATHLTRLVFVFGLALIASAARGQRTDTTMATRDIARPQLAGFGFVSLPKAPKKDSIRIIESDEEVVIVEASSAPKTN